MERKNKSLVKRILCFALVAGLVIGSMFYPNIHFGPIPPPPPRGLVFGTPYGPSDLDPQYAWDRSSIKVIDQVCEGLFRYN